MSKKLNLFAYAISIAGLLAQFATFIPFSRDTSDIVRAVTSLLSTLSLTFFRSNFLFYSNFNTGLQINFLDLTVYSLLLVGAIAWTVSKGRETRLVRAILALIFLQQVLFLLSNIVFGIVSFQQYLAGPPIWSIVLLLSMIEHTVLPWFLFKTLKEDQQTRKLQAETHDVDNNEKQPAIQTPAPAPTLVYATGLKRFANLLIDLFLCLFVLVPFAASFRFFLGPIEEKFGERFAIYVFLIIARLIYYPFFETILGATPGKLFTGTRVVTDDDEKTPSLATNIYRTLCRFIPFEPFSFLFAMSGWHDSLTNTRVVNEERTGVRLLAYGLIIPAIILVATITYFAHEQYEDYKSYVYQKESHARQISDIQKHLSRLDTTHMIKLKDVDQPYASEEVFLKVEEINGGQITAYVIELSQNYTKSVKKIEDLYTRGKASGFLSVVAINRSDLDKAYTVDYDKSESRDRNSVKFLKDDRRFEIEYIDRMFRPTIHDRGTGSQGGESGNIYINLLNHGWPARVVALETLEGTIKWPEVVDIEAPTVGQWDSPDFSVSGYEYMNGDHYKFKMIVRDSLGRDYTYIVDGHDMKKTVELVE